MPPARLHRAQRPADTPHAAPVGNANRVHAAGERPHRNEIAGDRQIARDTRERHLSQRTRRSRIADIEDLQPTD